MLKHIKVKSNNGTKITIREVPSSFLLKMAPKHTIHLLASSGHIVPVEMRSHPKSFTKFDLDAP